MTVPDKAMRAALASRWIAHALDDGRVAHGCLDLRPPVPGTAAYHCQQATEKLLKACLVLACVEFRKTHDLYWLGELAIAAFPNLKPIVDRVTGWNAWGIAYRYPAEQEPEPKPTSSEIMEALDVIAALAEAVQALL